MMVHRRSRYGPTKSNAYCIVSVSFSALFIVRPKNLFSKANELCITLMQAYYNRMILLSMRLFATPMILSQQNYTLQAVVLVQNPKNIRLLAGKQQRQYFVLASTLLLHSSIYQHHFYIFYFDHLTMLMYFLLLYTYFILLPPSSLFIILYHLIFLITCCFVVVVIVVMLLSSYCNCLW